MKRCAILLGNDDGVLSTDRDLDKVYRFLRSNRGGAWEDGEIIKQANVFRAELDLILSGIREEKFDFTIFYFAGHGKYARGTSLVLNSYGETINESELSNLGARQLNIFDCCRGVPEKTTIKVADSFMPYSLTESGYLGRMFCRALYDVLNMSAAPQLTSLYACEIDKYAYDSGQGGMYTNHLIDAANTFQGLFLLASKAHNMAIGPTSYEASIHGEEQTPVLSMVKLPAAAQIVLAINEKKYHVLAILLKVLQLRRYRLLRSWRRRQMLENVKNILLSNSNS